jgi:hypothetical protein
LSGELEGWAEHEEGREEAEGDAAIRDKIRHRETPFRVRRGDAIGASGALE